MRAKTIGRLAGLTWLAVAFVVANTTAPLAVSPAGATDAVNGTSQGYQDQAQSYFERFFKYSVSSIGARNARAGVQVSVQGDIVWLRLLAKTQDGYSGELVQEGALGKAGDVVEFKKENVQDWRFMGRNKLYYGDFQLRAKLERVSREDAARLAPMLTKGAVPPGW